MTDSARIELGNGKYLYVDKYQADPSLPEEITVYIGDDEIVLQDIALIRPSLDLNGLKVDHSYVDVLVWANANDEDYTHKFEIQVLSEED